MRGPRPREAGRDPRHEKLCIVDTNVVVSGLLDETSNGPPARVLDAMVGGRLLYLLSPALLSEYSAVLRRPAILERHGLTSGELDRFLTELVANAVWREPVAGSAAPDRGDDHLWALLAAEPGAHLVTGDRLLQQNPPSGASIVSPRHYVAVFLS